MGQVLLYDVFRSPMGWIAVMASQIGLIRTTLPHALRESAVANLPTVTRKAIAAEGYFDDLADRLSRYLMGEMVKLDDSLDLTEYPPFFKAAWIACTRIPLGETRSYSWLAAAAGKRGAFRAAGQAMAHNPLPILIPCHRVIATNGKLCGYGGGLKLKAKLLRLEALISAGRV